VEANFAGSCHNEGNSNGGHNAPLGSHSHSLDRLSRRGYFMLATAPRSKELLVHDFLADFFAVDSRREHGEPLYR
jgi:hypothetical protein